MRSRRMFSNDIVTSDPFLDMPVSAREMYFQLGMRADDDGFVSPRTVMRSIGASEDDLKILIAKNFVIPFENVVIVIRHWRTHNTVRADRYQPTDYKEQRRKLVLDGGTYIVAQHGNQLAPKRLPSGRLSKEVSKKESNVSPTEKNTRESTAAMKRAGEFVRKHLQSK